MLKYILLTIIALTGSQASAATYKYKLYAGPVTFESKSTDWFGLEVGDQTNMFNHIVRLHFEEDFDGPVLGSTVQVTGRNFFSEFWGGYPPETVQGTVTIDSVGKITDTDFFAVSYGGGVVSEAFRNERYEIYFEPLDIFGTNNSNSFRLVDAPWIVPLPAGGALILTGLIGLAGLRPFRSRK